MKSQSSHLSNDSRWKEYRSAIHLSARKVWRLIPAQAQKRVWDFWGTFYPYQQMSYHGKVLSWGVDRSAPYHFLFPTSPAGKTVLDVGCYTGFYCLQASSDGATYCLGIDIRKDRVAKGRALLAKERISNVELVAADVRRYNFDRTFDVVLCLNLMQHLNTIQAVHCLLTQLETVANERLILIVPLTTTPDTLYQYAIRNSVRYVLLSEQYFRMQYGEAVTLQELPDSYYGPHRAAVIIDKRRGGSNAMQRLPNAREQYS